MNDRCQPHCTEPCENGICTAPNVCECFEDYSPMPFAESRHICEPICTDPPCHNGICVRPNVCKCLPGFEVSADNRTCQPVCDPSCVFGECTDGRCECEPGFRMVNGSTHLCEPHCDKPCLNGTCYGRNMCLCDDGFVLNDDFVCTPICLCVAGTCNEHNTCECDAGYRLQQDDDGGEICEPICGGLDENCANGTCLRPDECLCFDGFEKSKTGNFKCVLLGSDSAGPEVALAYHRYTRYMYLVYIVLAGTTAVVLVLLIMRRHRKVDYSVKKAGNCDFNFFKRRKTELYLLMCFCFYIQKKSLECSTTLTRRISLMLEISYTVCVVLR